MNRIIILLACSLLIASAQASLTVYLDDYGPATDTILSINVLTEATRINPSIASELPQVGAVKLFSEYDSRDTPILAISHGTVWIIADTETTLTRALSEALENLGSDYTLESEAPDALAGYTPPAEPAEQNTTAPAPLSEPLCEPSDETKTYCDDGTVEEECRCVEGVLVCERFDCPDESDDKEVEEADEVQSEETREERRGFFSRIIDFLFGWIRR